MLDAIAAPRLGGSQTSTNGVSQTVSRMTEWTRKRIDQAVSRRGYRVVHETHADEMARTSFVKLLLQRIEPTLVLDVGGNVGQFRSWLRNDLQYKGRGESYEPYPEAAAQLRRESLHDPRWAVHELALGKAIGTAVLNVMSGKGELNSLLEPDDTYTVHLSELNQVRHTIRVEVRTLAEFVPRTGETVYLKIDTQGSDLAILEGAGSALDHVAIVQTEVSFTPIYRDQPTAVSVLKFLETHNFTLAGMYRNNRAGFPRQLLEADAFFVRRDLTG